MSDMQDIREWARANGWDIADKGRMPGDAKAAYDAAHNGTYEADEPLIIRPDPEEVPVPAQGAEKSGADNPAEQGPGERKPEAPRKPGLFQRRPKGPKQQHRRVSIENVLSSGWAIGAMALARKPQAIPVAKVLDMQAPVAGIIGEELLKGTVVDRVLQPLARGGRKAELATALVGPPMIVAAMTAQPGLFPVLRPVLKMTMMSWLEISEPAVRQVQKRQERWAEKFGDVDLDAMIDLLFEAPEPAAA